MVRTSIVVVLLALAACASPSLFYSGAITTTEARPRDVATKRVTLKDRVVVVTRVDRSDAGTHAGSHAVRWNWYEGETLIAERAKTIDFGSKPFRFSQSLQASDLGVGHYRVEVLVDDVKVDEQSFDVVALVATSPAPL